MSNFGDIIREAKKQGPIAQDFKCQFCGKGFVRESTLTAHLCESKRRHQQRDEVGVRLGYQAWLRFYELTQGSAKTKTYEDYAGSSYYVAFTKFGRHLHSLRAVNPSAFIDYVIKNNKKLDHWCRDAIYAEYLFEYLRRENAVDALERSIIEINLWAIETEKPMTQFFTEAPTTKICQMITNGRISPWVIYCCNTGLASLERLNEEQVALVYPWIDPDYWQRRLKDYMTDTEWSKHVLTKAGF